MYFRCTSRESHAVAGLSYSLKLEASRVNTYIASVDLQDCDCWRKPQQLSDGVSDSCASARLFVERNHFPICCLSSGFPMSHSPT